MLAAGFAIASPALAQSSASEQTPLFDEPRIIAKTMSWVEDFGRDESGAPKDGFYPELGHMITGAGWISVGPGYRRHLLGGQALVDVSAAISWRAYKIAQGRLEFPHLANDRVSVGSQVFWQDFTQVRYFGLGPDSHETDVSDFRVQASNVVGYATWRPRASVQVVGRVGWLSRPSLSASAGSFDRDEPDTLTMFREDPAVALERQPRFAHGELSIVADTRNHPSYPTEGMVVRGAWSTYRDQPTGTLAFDRYEGEAACFLPIARRGVIAARFWGVFTDTREGRAVPFYLMPSLGGHNTLRGFADYRFHDRNLVVANLESRWALFEHVDAAVFFDAGNVAARADDLNFDRTSYGVGMRLHTAKTTVARFDIARSREGWRFLLKLSDSLRLVRFARRTAALPFVP
jgi:outer membrane protein assembly factor BamA